MTHRSRITAVNMNCNISGANESLYATWTYVRYAKGYGVDVAYASVWIKNMDVSDAIKS